MNPTTTRICGISEGKSNLVIQAESDPEIRAAILRSEILQSDLPFSPETIQCALSIIGERQRAKEKGWTPIHDIHEHPDGALAKAAGAHLCFYGNQINQGHDLWPFDNKAHVNPGHPDHLKTAAAFILSEMERRDTIGRNQEASDFPDLPLPETPTTPHSTATGSSPDPKSEIPNPQSTALVLDLETLSRKPDAVVDELGVLVFDATTFDIIEEHGILLDIGEQIQLGRGTEADTIAHRRRNGTYPDHFAGAKLDPTLSRLQLLIEDHQPEAIWIWGKDFDRPILDSLFDSVGRSSDFPYWKIRCARDTYKAAFGAKSKGSSKTHHALDDCRVILSDLQEACARLDHLPST